MTLHPLFGLLRPERADRRAFKRTIKRVLIGVCIAALFVATTAQAVRWDLGMTYEPTTNAPPLVPDAGHATASQTIPTPLVSVDVPPIPARPTASQGHEISTKGPESANVSGKTVETVLPPIMLLVAKCESGGRQFNPDGTVLRGRIDRDDIGYLQINTRYWGALANQLGHDIFTLEGNKAMGKYIYDHEGTRPWSASAGCWNGSGARRSGVGQ